jgi:hypothetical protein
VLHPFKGLITYTHIYIYIYIYHAEFVSMRARTRRTLHCWRNFPVKDFTLFGLNVEDSVCHARYSIPMLVQYQSSKLLCKLCVVCTLLLPVHCPLESMVSHICISLLLYGSDQNIGNLNNAQDNKLGSVLDYLFTYLCQSQYFVLFLQLMRQYEGQSSKF